MAHEKQGFQLLADTRRRGRGSPMRFVAAYGLLAAACLAAVYSISRLSADVGDESPLTGKSSAILVDDDPESVWDVVPRSSVDNLTWVSCYDTFECATLQIPLDYANPSAGSGYVAMTKLPSKVSKFSANYRGPILFNPGGPGGSGVSLIVHTGAMVQKVLGDDYDLIGFDPRGIGRTQPAVNVFPDELEGARWRLTLRDVPLVNTTQDAVSRQHAMALVYGDLAEARTQQASPYVSTALVCRDMLRIMNAHGRDKLQYWGFSYGTVLGATFAAMFPDHVERLIIDGVEDPYDYYSALWETNLVDTTKGLRLYFQECVDAGPEACAFYESSVDKIEARYNQLLSKLKYRPLAVQPTGALSTPTDYGIVDYRTTLSIVFQFLYDPYTNGVAPTLAVALAAAERGDARPLWDLQKAGIEQFTCKCPSRSTARTLAFSEDASAAISCSDGDLVRASPQDLQDWYDQVGRDSEFVALWPLHVRCTGWKIRSVERFAGPFVGNTSFPLLLIGNTADPVTPIRNAHAVSKGFNGSVVLTQNSAGHCSLAGASLCIAKAVREYFREGKLPEPGTVCELDQGMFPKPTLEAQSQQVLSALTVEDREIMEAWKTISQEFEIPRFGIRNY